MQLHPTNTQTEGSKTDQVAIYLHSVSKYILVAVFGLVPILFIPIDLVPFGYTKTLLIVVGVFAALIFFSLSVLRSGKVVLGTPWALLGLWGVAGVAVVSALLSGDLKDSFVGDAFSVHSALFLVLLALVASITNVFAAAKSHIMQLYMVLVGSTIILGVYHLLRIFFGETFLSLGIFTSSTSSPIGSWNDLGLFFGLSIILSMISLEQLPLPRMGKLFFSGVTLIALVMLMIVNFFAVWVVLGLVSLVMLMYALTKDRFGTTASPMGIGANESSSLTSILVSILVFVVSVLFVTGGSFVGSVISEKTNISFVEIRPSMTATFDIARQVYSENAFLGIGPNRFEDAWRLHKDRAINDTIFWNTDFAAGNGYITTMFVTTGVFGAMAWVVFFGLYVYGGIRMLLRSAVTDRFWFFIGTSSFVAAVYLWIMSVVYVPGSAILLLAAVCTGISFVARGALLSDRTKEITLSADRRAGFVLIAIVMLVIIASVSVLYGAGRHYLGLYNFNQALASLQSGANLKEIEIRIADAFEISNNDSFANQIAVYQLARMNNLLAVQSPNEAQQQQFQEAIANGINAAQLAVNEDPTNPLNWATLGSVYSVLATANIEGAVDRANEAFAEARRLSPLNPEYALLEAQLASRVGSLETAREKANESARLKPNYTQALFFLTQLDIAEGNVEAAIGRTQAIISLEPRNAARYYQLGILLTSANQIEDAARVFERAIQIDNSYANARYFLALTYLDLNRPDEAVTQLEFVRDLSPSNVQVQALIDQIKQGNIPTTNTNNAVAEPAPVTDAADVTSTDQAVPDTDLLTPVNTVYEEAADSGAGEVEEVVEVEEVEENDQVTESAL